MIGNLRFKLRELAISEHAFSKTELAFVNAVRAIKDLKEAWKEEYDTLLAEGFTENEAIQINDELSKHTHFFDVLESIDEE